MNGTDQRVHRTATAALAARADDLSTVVEALDARLAGVAATLARLATETNRRLEELSTQANSVARQQRAYVDTRDLELGDTLRQFKAMTLRQRLRWLVRGSA